MLSLNTPTPAGGQESAPATPETVRRTLSLSSPNSLANASNSQASAPTHDRPKEHHIWAVTGPAGCGKSTVAMHLAQTLALPYLEGDEYHPKSNIEKMSKGIPLTDEDRWDWLTVLREESIKMLDAGHDGVVVTCSALKRKYRDVIRVAPYYSPNVTLHFIYLHAPEEVLMRRVLARKDHFFTQSMVHSQFAVLQPPVDQEDDVIKVDVSRPINDVKADVLAKVCKVMEEPHKHGYKTH